MWLGLHSSGISTTVHYTSVLTKEEKDKLWSLGIFACDNARSLQHTIFFSIGKRFCIRGEEEMWKLGPSQFKRSFNPDCITYMYVEHGFKNYSGRASDLRFENKEEPCPPIPSLNSRCLVFFMDLYLGKLPLYGFEKDILFLWPKQKAPSDTGEAWYEKVAIGKNTLSAMVKDMCQKAGVRGKTNHSMRASGATAMFQKNIPEHVIQNVTRHQSLD